MRKYYKAASLAIAGALVAGSVVPLSAKAEEDVVVEAAAPSEAVSNEMPEEVATANTTAEETTVEAETEAAANDVANISQADDTESVVEDPVAKAAADVTAEEPVAEESTSASEEDGTVEVVTEQPTEKAVTTEPVAEESVAEESVAEESVAEETVTDETLGEEKLEEKLEEEELELLDPKDSEDFNEDGISDLMTKLLCDGEILTKDGKKAFGDLSYEQVQATDDLDGDGLLNGAEVRVISEDGHEYVVLNSDPCKLDTDGDGINDADDTAPWERGLAGGVLGSVRLISRYDENASDPTNGHVYIVYTSYVNNLEISIENLYGYYVTNPEFKNQLDAACDSPDADIVSWRSTASEITEANEAERAEEAEKLYPEQMHKAHTAGTVVLNRGDYVSIGNYGMSNLKETVINDYLPQATKIFAHNDADIANLWNAVTGGNVDEEYVRAHLDEIIQHLAEDSMIFVEYAMTSQSDGGVWINRELHNQKYAYDQSPNQVVEHDATAADLNVMLGYFSKNSYFNIFTHNCSTVGAGAWNETFGYEKNEAGEKVVDADGNAVKTEYYANADINTPVGVMNFPAAVKKSIAAMAEIPGYIGEMTYVTGKKLVNTINQAVKYFDVSKLFTKKAKTNNEPQNTENNNTENTSTNTGVNTDNGTGSNNTSSASNSSNSTANGSSNGGYKGYYSDGDMYYPIDGSIVTNFTSVPGTEDYVGEEEVEANNRTGRTSRRSAGRTNRVAAAGDEEELNLEEEVIEQEAQLEETTEEVQTIQEEETPLAIEKESKSDVWQWAVFGTFVAVAAGATGIVIKKKNS